MFVLHLLCCWLHCGGPAREHCRSVGDLYWRLCRGLGGLPFARVRGIIERHNAYAEDPVQLRGGWHMDAASLYEQALIGPADLDFVQTYDDYPVISSSPVACI